MNRLYQQFDFSQMPFLWSHLQRSEPGSGFAGYYHWHQGCELLFVHEGRGRVLVGRNTYPLQAGMLFFFQPFQLHNVRVELEPSGPAYVRTTFHFDPLPLEPFLKPFASLEQIFRYLIRGADPQQAFDLSDVPSAAAAIEAFERCQASGADEAELVERAGLLLAGLLSAIRDLGDDEPTAGERPQRYSERIVRWLEACYAEPFDLERLAADLHLTKAYVSRIFRMETGSSITDYLIARRIKQACRLLRTTDLPVERIGQEVGLPNASYFTQLFKRTVGTTPLRYRTGASWNEGKKG